MRNQQLAKTLTGLGLAAPVLHLLAQQQQLGAFRLGLGLLALLFGVGWMREWRRYRHIVDLPLSRIASAAQGYVSLCGRGSRGHLPEVISPLTGLRCLWYSYHQLGERKHGQRSFGPGKPSWGSASLQPHQSEQPFLLDDGSGQVIVDPRGASIDSSRYEECTVDGIRYGHRVLLEQDVLYVLGELHQPRSGRAMHDAIGDLLAQWKAEPTALLERHDRNGDGQIDQAEWDAVRAAATREVSQRDVILPPQILGKPSRGQPYLIANHLPERLALRLRLNAWLRLAIAVVCTTMLLASLTGRIDLARPGDDGADKVQDVADDAE